MALKAVIFVPPGPSAQRWWDLCTAYCAEHGYHLAVIASCWDDVLKLVWEKRVDVVVAARRDHLPPDRKPRLEVIDEQQTPAPTPEQRRPVIQRREDH